MTLINACFSCGKTHELEVPDGKMAEWEKARRAGTHVQDFWPELTPAEREEFFISGMCDACWKKMEEEAEDEEDDP